MANWTTLKDALVSVIRTNGNQEITGQLLQNTLLDIINSVGKHYQFIGLASQGTIPQVEDGYAFYIASSKGEYPNFNITIPKNGLYIIRNNNSNAWEVLDTNVLAYKDQDCYNLLYHKPLPEGVFYTHETAIAAVPSDIIKPGLSIKYLLANGTYVYEQFTATSIDAWTDTNSWEALATLSNLNDINFSINEVINTKVDELNQSIEDTNLEVSWLDQNKMEKDGSNSNVSMLKFNTTLNPTLDQIGQIKYNPETKSFSGKTSADTEYDFGLEVIKYVKNNQGADILNGKVVYVSGGQGKNVLVKLATTTDQDIAQRAFAVATQNISTFGFVCTYGAVRGINTSAFAEGDRLYLSTNGNVTNVEPVAPTPKIFIGICTYSHAINGEIDVQIRPIARLSKLSDVHSPTNATGNVLKWNDTTKRYENFNIDSELVQIRADLNIGLATKKSIISAEDDHFRLINLIALQTGYTGYLGNYTLHGFEYTPDQNDDIVTLIGNTNYNTNKPIQSQMRPFEELISTKERFYLRDDVTKRIDGSASNLIDPNYLQKVYVPEFWYGAMYDSVRSKIQLWFSLIPVTGFMHIAPQAVCRYPGYIDGTGKARSHSGFKYPNNKNLVEFTTACQLTSEDLFVLPYYTYNALALLLAHDIGRRNAQAVWSGLQTGVTYSNITSGKTNVLTTPSGEVSADAETASNKPFRWRFIENLYGDCWKIMSGVYCNQVGAERRVMVCPDPYKANTNSVISADYIQACVIASGEGWLKDINAPWINAKTYGATSTTGYGDYTYNNTTDKNILVAGGTSSGGALDGPFSLYSGNSSLPKLFHIGALFASIDPDKSATQIVKPALIF